jgi:large subunit ribosomal protein L27
MAKHKTGGGNRQGQDSESKRLGIKRYDGQLVTCGTIIVRQRGTKFLPGSNVDLGKDYTIFSMIEGYVKFENVTRDKQRVSVCPERQ